MATRTVSNAGGNWNATTTWVGGVVPIAGDDVNFTATSGNLTVNVSTANLVGIDFTNYVGTITFNNNINTNGTVNLGTGGYTQAGVSGLNINGNATISGSTVWNNLTLSSTLTLTLSSNLTVTNLTAAASSNISFTLGGNILSVTGTLTIFNVTNFNTPSNLQVTNLVIGNGSGSGNININGSFTISVSGNLTENRGGTSVCSGNTSIELNGTGTWSNTSTGALRNNLTINSPSGTITVSGNVYYNTGVLTYTSGTVNTAVSTLIIGASTTLDTDRGSTKITWNNVTIAIITTAVITLSSNLDITGTTTLQATATTLSFALSFAGVGIFNPSGALVINNSTTSATTFTITIPSVLTVTNLTLAVITSTNNSIITLNTNSINVTGNLTVGTSANTLTILGTTSINLTGTGIWSHSSGGILRNNLTINSPSGTITVSGTVNYNTGTLTYTAGTVTTTSSTLNIGASTTIDTDRGATRITWDNVTITTGTITLSSNLTVGGTLTLTGTMTGAFTITTVNLTTGSAAINVTSTSVTGNLTINGSTSGTLITLNGIGSQTWSHGSAVNLSNSLTINKSSGTLTIGTNVYYITGTLTYTAGIVDTTTNSSTLNIGGSTTLNTNSVTWNNVTITTGTITLTSNFVMSNTLTIGTTSNQTITFSGVGVLSPTITCNLSIPSNSRYTTLNLPYDITVNNFTFSVNVAGGGVQFTLNNSTINILGDLSLIQSASNAGYYLTGTGSLAMIGNGTWSSTYQPFRLSASWYNYISLNMTFNTTGIINIVGSVGYGFINNGISLSKTITYISGTINATSSILWVFTSLSFGSVQGVIFNTNTMMWGSIYQMRSGGASNSYDTLTLLSDLNMNGTLYFWDMPFSNSLGFIINGGYNINMASLLVGHGGGVLTGTATFVFNKTGSWVHNTAISVSNNIVIDTLGTLTISGNVYYNTRTLRYITGNVDTTGSTLNVTASSTLNTSGMTWSNVTLVGTQTLTTGLNVGGNLTTQTTAVVLSGVVNVNVGGNLAINIATSGTATIILNGTSAQTWSHGSAVYLSNSLTINKSSGTLTIGTNVYYNTGTLLYTAGTVDTTTNNSTLNINASTTLNTSGITWRNVTLSATSTITLTSNFTWTNLWSVTAGTITFAGVGTIIAGAAASISFSGSSIISIPSSFQVVNATLGVTTINTNTISISGNLTINGATSGTTNLILNGSTTQTWSHGSAVYLSNNLTINSTGTIILGSNIYYGGGTLTHTAGSITVGTFILFINTSTTLNTSSINWYTINLTGINTNLTLTLTSGGNLTTENLYCPYNTTFNMLSSGLLTVNESLAFGFQSFSIVSGQFGPVTITLPNNLIVNNLSFYTNINPNAFAAYGVTINNHSITVNGNIYIYNLSGFSIVTLPVFGGTTKIYWSPKSPKSIIYQIPSPIYNANFDFDLTLDYGTDYTFTSNVIHRNNITINSNNFTKLNGVLNLSTGTMNCVYGTVNAKNFNLNLQGNITLKNINKIVFNTVTITSGVLITMNEFFSGSSDKKTNILASSTTNYTITFQDRTEKFTKFVKVNRATLSVPGQLTVITDKGNQGNNVGIVFAPNQKANGLPKNTPSVLESTYGSNSLLTDPTLNLV